MADRALSEEAMLSGLRGIHLPPDPPGGPLAEIAAAAGFGLLLALLIATLLRVFTFRRTPAAAAPDPEKILSGRNEGEQRTLLLHALKARKPEAFHRLKSSLYRPDTPLDTASLLRELRDD
ncbi:hypothetical protein [Salipiger sp.]|uniref:hypothetical protein n=1 Tax=Salipiger sp. TaxID=2078585 RepID=UPI003A96D787